MKQSALKTMQLLLACSLLAMPVQGYALTVRTADIVDGAVTSPKIADRAVTNTKIAVGAVTADNLADGAVTDAKISGTISGAKLTDGSISATKLAPGAVGTGAIVDGAVTDAKVSGVISGNKLGAHAHQAGDVVGTISASSLPIGTSANTVAAGDHVHPELQKYAGVVVVAKSGGDYTSLAAAINAISPTADSPYLIKIMPGVYDEPAMYFKSNIDIEGSGTASTIIRPQFSGQSYVYCGVSLNGSMSNLSIIAENIPSNFAPYLFYLNNTSGYNATDMFKFINVDIKATSTGSFNIYGITSNNNNLEFRNSSINLDLKDGSYAIGLNMYGSNITVKDSKIQTKRSGPSGNPLSIGLHQLGGTARIAGSEFESTDDLPNFYHAAVLSGGCSGGCGVTPEVFITNSTLKGNTTLKTTQTNGVEGLISATSSQLVGEITGNVKLFNNYDANLSAIANR